MKLSGRHLIYCLVGLIGVLNHSFVFAGGAGHTRGTDMSSDVTEFRYTPGHWNFPSDHLPVIAEVRFPNGVIEKIMTFNILNENYKKFIYLGQKLDGSVLAGMTEKERIDSILKLIQEGADRGVSLFGLQEVSSCFISELSKTSLVSSGSFKLVIAQNIRIDQGRSKPSDDYGVILVRDSIFSVASDLTEVVPYRLGENSSNKYIQKVILTHKSSDLIFGLINTHVEFGKGEQIAKFLVDLGAKNPTLPIIAVGDFNLGFQDGVKYSVRDSLRPFLGDFEVMNSPGFTHVSTNDDDDKKLDRYDLFVYRNPVGISQIEIYFGPEVTDVMRKFQKQALGL